MSIDINKHEVDIDILFKQNELDLSSIKELYQKLKENVDRVQLNYLAKQLANPNYDNPAGSYIEGDLYDNGGFRCGYKAIATPGKMIYEAKNLSNYYLNNAKANTFNYTYSDTEFAKVKCSDGSIKIIGYKS